MKKFSRLRSKYRGNNKGKVIDEDDKNKKVNSVGTLELFRYTNRIERIAMIIGIIFGLLQAVTQAIWLNTYSFIVNQFTNFEITNGTSNSSSINSFKRNILVNGVTVFITVGIANVILVFISTWCWAFVADRNIRRIRSLVFRSMLRQEIGWYDCQSPGELSIRLSEDVYNIWVGTGDKIADILLLSSKSIGGIVMALISGWKLALVFICFLPLVGGSLVILITVIKVFTEKELNAYGKAGYVAEEVLSAIKTVQAFNGQVREGRRYDNNLHDARRLGIRKSLFIGISQLFVNLFLYASFAVLVWYGPLLIREEPHYYTPGTVMVVFFGVLISTFSLGSMAPNIQSFAEARASASKIFEIIERKSHIDITSKDGLLHTPTGSIDLKNITFKYPARTEYTVFDDFTLSIKPGQTVALVGSSGCGKSTILQLIQRFYDPEKGQVLFDGHDLRSLNLGQIRSSFGIVSQEPVLFFGTIAENIELGKPGATQEEIIAAAITSNAHDFIKTLPMGYDTVIGERGSTLSGGQKQRIAIARAIISHPPILLLDEATSALDSESEKIVQDALDKAVANRTTIVVAHRLSTIKNADIIYVLDRGKIMEQGIHSELMLQRGLYYELVTAQSTNADKIVSESTSSMPVVKYSSYVDDIYESESSDEEFDFDSMYAQPPRISFSQSTKKSITGKKSKYSRLSKRFRRFFKRMISNTDLIMKIFMFNLKEIPYIIGGIICAVVVAAVLPVFSILFTELFNVFTKPVEEQIAITKKLSLTIFGLGAFGGLSTLGYSFLLGKSGEELTFRMRSRSFSSMLSQDMSWFDMEENRVGALLTRLSLDASQLKGMTGQRIAILIQSASFVIIGGTLCFIYSWEMTLTMMAIIPLVLFGGIIQGQKLNRTVKSKSGGKKNTVSWEEEGGKMTSETLNNIRTVVSMKREHIFIDKFEYFYKQLYKQNSALNWKTAFGNGIGQSVMYFIFGIAVGVGVELLIKERVEFYNIFRVISLVNMAGSAVGRGSAFLVDFETAKQSAGNILSIIKRKPLIDSLSNEGQKPDLTEFNIKCKDVSFAYPTRPNIVVLNNVSFSIPDGISTAFVGPSGCGKSTIVALILRFYDVQAGTVNLHDVDIRKLNLLWLRSKIGFPENEATMEMVVKAAKLANVHEDIIRLPLGYKTKVGSKGTQLSGGQKQRISIARALIRNPRILLLDEATSALDSTSEKVVQAALDNAKFSRTTLSIAHRLGTIKDCEQIIVVNEGGIVEFGSHEELLKRKGLYAQLASSQSMK
ncbi:hypothetical protein GJ496_006297 [Pomphorhynchus laevis]|nr:hypothetical protein GJ496_006297 [Pomphorhynchus laevis]